VSTQLQKQSTVGTELSKACTFSGLLQRKCACGGMPRMTGECGECQKKSSSLQRATLHPSSFSPHPSEVPSIVHDVLRSPGRSLDAATRDFFEGRFGHDFSQVRVHTDARAAESARAVNALAYTVGRDVVFGAGQYAPESSEGRRLLAHELVHVEQQGGGRWGPGSTLELGATGNASEQQAAAATTAVAEGSRSPLANVGRATPNSVLRQEGGGTGGTGGPVVAPVALPPDYPAIQFQDSSGSSCWGYRTPARLDLYSRYCPVIKPRVCPTSSAVEFDVAFYVDGGVARPRPPAVSVTFQFGPPGKKGSYRISVADSAPSFVRSTYPLGTSFPSKFRIPAAKRGFLKIDLTIDDTAGSGLAVTYSDVIEIKCPVKPATSLPATTPGLPIPSDMGDFPPYYPGWEPPADRAV
jgi:hypothetical protein